MVDIVILPDVRSVGLASGVGMVDLMVLPGITTVCLSTNLSGGEKLVWLGAITRVTVALVGCVRYCRNAPFSLSSSCCSRCKIALICSCADFSVVRRNRWKCTTRLPLLQAINIYGSIDII